MTESRNRLRAALALCLAGCSTQPPVATGADAQRAQSADMIADTVLVDLSSYDDARTLAERVNAFGVLQSRDGDRWSFRDARTRKTISIRLREDY